MPRNEGAKPAMLLCACYALSGTAMAYASIASYALSRTAVVFGGMRLRASYALSGTDLRRAAVPRQLFLLRELASNIPAANRQHAVPAAGTNPAVLPYGAPT
eukprot:3508868-Rhodomonas_salina.1